MKAMRFTKIILLTVGLGAPFSSVAIADPKNRQDEKMLIQEPAERYVRLTGSNIPQRVTLRSIGTNAPYNIRIYTQRELLSTGRQTPGEALAAIDPSITLSYGR